MAKNWTVHADGVDHQIQYKGGKLIVDGAKYKLKSANWFIQLVDYAINFGDTSCRLVVIGTKVDLAVNGKYLGSGETYEPIANIPVAVSIFAGVNVALGGVLNGWLGACIGLLFGALWFKLYMKKKNLTPVIIFFAIACVFQIILGIVVSALYLSL